MTKPRFEDPSDSLQRILRMDSPLRSELWPLPQDELMAMALQPCSLLDAMHDLSLGDAQDMIGKVLGRRSEIDANIKTMCRPSIDALDKAIENRDWNLVGTLCVVLEACGLLIGDRDIVVRAKCGLGEASLRQEKTRESVVHAEAAADILDCIGSEDTATELRRNIAAAQQKSGQHEDAIDTVMKWVRIGKERGQFAQVVLLAGLGAKIAEDSNNPSMAGTLQSENEHALKKIQDELDEARVLQSVLASLAQATSNADVEKLFEENRAHISKRFVLSLVRLCVGPASNVDIANAVKFLESSAILLGDPSLVWKYPMVEARNHEERGNLSFALATYNEIVNVTLSAEDWASAASAYIAAGNTLGRLNKPQEVIEKNEAAAALAERVTDKVQRAHIMVASSLGIAHGYMDLGEYSTACSFFEEAWKQASQREDSELKMRAADFASVCWRRQGDYQKAFEWQERQLEALKKTPGSKPIEIGCLCEIGINLIKQWGGENAEETQNWAKLDEAEATFRKAEELATGISNLDAKSTASTNLGVIALLRRDYDKAIKIHEDTLDLNRRVARSVGIAESFGNIACVSERMGLVRQAMDNRRNALTWYWRSGSLDRVVSTLREMALQSGLSGLGESKSPALTLAFLISAWRKRKKDVIETAIALAKECEGKHSFAKCREALSRALQFPNEKSEQIELQLTELLLVSLHGDLSEAEAEISRWTSRGLTGKCGGMVCEAVSNVANRKKKNDDELDALLKAAELYSEAGQIDKRIAILGRIAEVYERLGNHAKAKGYYNKIWKQKSESSLYQAEAAFQLGILSYDAGQYHEALRFHQANLHYLEGLTCVPLKGIKRTCHEIGITELALGNFEEAEKYFLRALQLQLELEDRRSEGRTRSNFVQALLGQQNYQEAQKQAELAVDIGREVKDPVTESIALYGLAWIAHERNDLPSALRHAKAGLSVDRKANRQYGMATKLDMVGHIHLSANRCDDAFQAYQEAAAIYQKLHLTEKLSIPYTGMATILADRGEYDRAIDLLEQALDSVVENVTVPSRTYLAPPEFAKTPRLVSELLRLKLVRERPSDEIHSTVQKGRARYLGRLLGTQTVKPSASIPVDLLAREQNLRLKRRGLEGQIERDVPFEVLQTLISALESTDLELSSLMMDIKEYDPVYVRMRQGEPPSEELIQGLLNKSLGRIAKPTAILEYYVLENETLIWSFIPHTDPLFVRIPVKRDELRELISAVVGNIQRPPKKEHVGPEAEERRREERLSHYLLPNAMVEKLKDIPHICVIPHDLLHYLPFCVLWNGNERMIHQHAFSIADSVFAACISMSSHEDNVLSFPRVIAVGVVSDKYGDSFLREPIKRSVYSVAAICGGDICLGKQATVDNISELLRMYDIVHIICHGKANRIDPMKSGLLVSATTLPNSESSSSVDYPSELELLTAKQLMAYDIRADLVFLNACVSAFDTIRPGDELVGLTRSLLWAGARSVIGTLWNVHGEAAEIMAKHFHQRFHESHWSKAESLANAQRKLSEHLKFTVPYYWAPYELFGAWI